jgi:EpsI family protein
VNRRDLLLGGGLLAAAGTAAALTPRKRLVLLGDRKLDSIVPMRVGDWTSVPSAGFVLPKSPGSLADRLYSQTVTRLYSGNDIRLPMMLVIAYGAVQNDLLQLHRPETCYSAVGYTISASRVANVPLAGQVQLPVRELTATNDKRLEQICYWTRIGDDLPTDGSQQRWVKLRQQFDGYLSDGLLVRISCVAESVPEVFGELQDFARVLVQSMRPSDRDVLIGRRLARGMVSK